MMGRGEKMAAARPGTLLRLVTVLLLLTAAISRGQAENVYWPSGSDFTLKPNYRGDFKEITWLLNSNKLVELDLDEKKEPVWYKSFPHLRAGASLNNQTGELTIPRLTISDSGDYKADVKLHDLTYNYTYITLTVQDTVLKPIITNKTTEKNIDLICDSASPGVNYKWQDDKGNIVSYKKTHTIPKPTEAAVTLTCIASNQVSEERVSVTFKPPGSGSAGIIGILVSILILVLLVLFFVLRWKYPAASVWRHFKWIPQCPCFKKGNGKDQEKGDEHLQVQENVKPQEAGNGTPDQQQPLLGNKETGDKNVTGSGEQNAQEVLAVNNQQAHESMTIEFILNTAQKDAIAGLKVKKDGELLYEVVDIQKELLNLQQNQEIVLKDNLVLKPGALIIKNLKPDDQEYEVAFNKNSSAQYFVKVPEGDTNALKIRRKMHLASENGLQEQPPTCNVTFHPRRITDKYIWKHDDKKLVGTSDKSEDGIYHEGKVKMNWQTGDLTLQNIMSVDNGTYTLEFADGTRQEFTLELLEELIQECEDS